jgi:transposase
MAKYKPYDYRQMVMLPVSLEDQLMPETLEFAIHTLVENHMEMSRFDERYHNDETGCSAYDPKVLLKVVLLGYSRGLISSRKIERACCENVVFIALACGQRPDHSTIAAFVSSMKGEILPLFRDVLLVCEEMNLLGGTFFALDGVKLPCNASKQWSGTISELRGKKLRIEHRVEQLLEQHEREDRSDEDLLGRGSSSQRDRREEQVKRLKKRAERIASWLEHNEAKVGAKGKEIRSNITDNESAKMLTAHGYIQGYNGQALVDSKHQVIVHGQACGDGQDHEHVAPMLDGAKENMEAIGHDEHYFSEKIVRADTNYHSGANLKKCDEMEVDAYIPDRFFRRKDPSYEAQRRHWPKRKERFALEDFEYMEATDQYLCPAGRRLRLETDKVRNSGNLYRRYVADERDCSGCTLRSRCLRSKHAKRRYLSVPIGTEGINYSKEMVAKMDTERALKIYAERLGLVEPVFANIRTHKRLDRFTLRGQVKVNIQWLLYCMVHNIEKIANLGFVFQN